VRDRNASTTSAVAHWVRSYRGRQGFREHPSLTTVKVAMPQPYPRRGEGEVMDRSNERSCLKSSSHRRVAV